MRAPRPSALLLLAGLALSAAPAAAQAPECLPLQVGNPDGNYVVPGVQGAIVYRRAGGAELRLDAYVQRQGKIRPGVVVVHGGRWSSGGRAAFTGQLLELLTRAGFNWFALDYRLGGLARYRDALEDLRGALAFIRCHASTLRVDARRLALLGEDSGAHLAALLAGERPEGVRAVALVGGLYDLRTLSGLDPAPSAELRERASAVSTVAPGMPEVLAVHGTADTESPIAQAAAYCEAVRQAGARCEVLSVAEGIHRAENWRPSQWGYKERLSRWLAERLGLGRPDHRPYAGRLRKDVLYSPRHGLKLDAYVPPGRGPFPAVVLVHGGGWEAGDKVTYITPLFEPLARAGFAWFSIDYRLTPAVRHPEQMDDLREAVAFIRANARRFRVDPRRLALLGESASGQMVALLATQDASLGAVVSFYGVYDFPSFLAAGSSRLQQLFGLGALDDGSRELLRRYSPLHNVSKTMPPVLLVHGTNERLWAQGLAMRDRLAQAGARHELLAVEGAPHGLESWEGRPEWTGYKRRLVEWLDRTLRRREAAP